MGRKIFISYKYNDYNVKNILGPNAFLSCKARDYVNVIEDELKDNTDHIYKGESDGEDLSQLSQETIWKKLKDRIYDSTLTIIIVSKGMRVKYLNDKYQWIPQEISYSLKEINRKNKNGDDVKSNTNALLAVILPDTYGNYDYFTYNKTCCNSGCTYYDSKSNYIFSIMQGNLFNEISPDKNRCDDGQTVYHGECSYMKCVKWEDFKDDMEFYIDAAYKIRERQNEYVIQKEIE